MKCRKNGAVLFRLNNVKSKLLVNWWSLKLLQVLVFSLCFGLFVWNVFWIRFNCPLVYIHFYFRSLPGALGSTILKLSLWLLALKCNLIVWIHYLMMGLVSTYLVVTWMLPAL